MPRAWAIERRLSVTGTHDWRQSWVGRKVVIGAEGAMVGSTPTYRVARAAVSWAWRRRSSRSCQTTRRGLALKIDE